MSENERAARYSDLFGSEDAGGSGQGVHSSNCAYCPICAAIGVVRNTKPEVLEHLAGAARELILAAGLLIEEAERVAKTAERGTRDRSGAKIRKINID
jgi:hypothetical protein